MIFAIQIAMARELFQISQRSSCMEIKHWSSFFQWYFFAVASFFMYGRWMKENIMLEIRVSSKIMSNWGNE